jgi:virginiamycin B lyase
LADHLRRFHTHATEVTELSGRRPTLALLAALSVAVIAGLPLVASASTMRAVEYPVSVSTGSILALTPGPDGAVWFTEKQAATIGRITPRGAVQLYPLPSPIPGYPSPQVIGITTGSDGALWFASAAPFAGRLSTAGVFSWFPMPMGSISVAAGPDGNLWFVELNGHIAQVTTTGVVTDFPGPPSGNSPSAITAGPDGAMWFSESAQMIGRLTTSGVYTEYALDHPVSSSCLATGGDGNVWIAEDGYLSEVSPTGAMKDHPAPAISGVGCIAAKGKLMWFTTSSGVGRMAPGGAYTTFAAPSGNGSFGICLGPDGHMWSNELTSIARWLFVR